MGLTDGEPMAGLWPRVCTNVDLWIALMNLLDNTQVSWEWPSHVDIPGNERADKLAAQGRNSSPLYLKVKHPFPLRRTPLVSTGVQRGGGGRW